MGVPGQPVRTTALAAMLAAQAQQRAMRQPQPPTQPQAPAVDSPALALVTESSPTPADDIRAWTERCQHATTALRNSMIELSYFGYRVCAAANWVATGLPVTSSDEFREFLGIGPKLWDRYMTLGERISHLQLKDLADLTVAKAEQLTAVHPKVWQEFPWVEEARLLTGPEFSSLVDQRNRDALGGRPVSSFGRFSTDSAAGPRTGLIEPKTKLSFDLPESQRRLLERRLLRARRVHQLRSQAEVIEQAIDALEQQEEWMETIREAKRLIRETVAVWPEGSESTAEQAARFTGDTATVESVQRTRVLLKRLSTILHTLSEKGACPTYGVEDHRSEGSADSSAVSSSPEPDSPAA